MPSNHFSSLSYILYYVLSQKIQIISLYQYTNNDLYTSLNDSCLQAIICCKKLSILMFFDKLILQFIFTKMIALLIALDVAKIVGLLIGLLMKILL